MFLTLDEVESAAAADSLSAELLLMAHRLSAKEPRPEGRREAALARWSVSVYRLVQGPVAARLSNLYLPFCYLGVFTWMLRQRTVQVRKASAKVSLIH